MDRNVADVVSVLQQAVPIRNHLFCVCSQSRCPWTLLSAIK